MRLRALTERDLDGITALATDGDSVRWTTIPHPYPPDGAREHLAATREQWRTGPAQGGPLCWAVETADHPFAGMIDVHPAPARWELGYALHPAARGLRLMPDAIRLASGWAFGQGAQTVSAYVVRGNWASRRVLWSCGFTVHPALPGWLPGRDGPPQDCWPATLAAGAPMTPAHRWTLAPRLAADGVALRPWRDDDVPREEPDHPAHFMAAPAPTAATFGDWLLDRREWVAAGRAVHWCVADARTDEALGEVGLFTRAPSELGDEAELGYQLFPGARGRGVMRTAARLAVDHAVSDLGFRRFTASCASDNAASAAVLRRLGFREWGREPAAHDLPGGGTADEVHWELTRGGAAGTGSR